MKDERVIYFYWHDHVVSEMKIMKMYFQNLKLSPCWEGNTVLLYGKGDNMKADVRKHDFQAENNCLWRKHKASRINCKFL